MPKTMSITLDDPKIDSVAIFADASNKVRAEARYSIRTDAGVLYTTGSITYWEVMPDEQLDGEGNPIPNPASFKQMPAGIATQLKALVSSALQALKDDHGF